MQAEVINTGSELLLGLVTNTHLAYLAEKLSPCGVTTRTRSRSSHTLFQWAWFR